MKLFNLGLVPPAFSQAVYHTLAREGIESLIVLSPASRYVCVGYFQNARDCVDLEYCKENDIPVIRREVGGGVVLLDSNQVFYQLILRKDNQLLPAGVGAMYEKFSGPPVRTYNRLGLPARHRPVNDIVALDGRKVSGQGGADIGPSQVFVGNIILDFDYDTMVRALRVPDEKFRDKIHKSMKDNLTTLKKELAEVPSRETVEKVLIEEFERVLGPLERAGLPASILPEIDEVGRRLSSEEFVLREGRRPRGVTIREGVKMGRADHKAPGGLISAEAEVTGGRLTWLWLGGDFTFRPKDAWEGLPPSLAGEPYNRESLEQAIARYYADKHVDSPGVSPSDIAAAILKAVS